MNKHVIRTSETDSVRGIPSKQHIDVNLQQTTKALPFPNVSTTISQRSLYEEERQTGNKFRLILTVVPYCSNVLFNALTEIIKDEGSDKVKVVTDGTTINFNKWNEEKQSGVYGKTNPDRVHMISNTEYSSKLHGGYEYHPGYDFFDNHILRNKTFKVVSRNNEADVDVFNTLSDFIRDLNGNKKKYTKRLSINSINSNQSFDKDKHLYLIDDILKIDESINQNLYEENGWWGFNNNTSIDTKEMYKTTVWNSMDISRALNNHKPCEFIDVYPDRTLFSFSPKYNEYSKVEENNWNVVVTYPYKNIYNHPICLGGTSYIKRVPNTEGSMVEETISEGNRWMGLKIMSATLGSGKAGGNNLIFRTYTKHGLSQQDMFYLYYTNPYKKTEEYANCEKFSDKTLNGGETYYETQTYYKVTNVGDLSRNNNDYYFYTSNLSLVKEIYKSYLEYVKKLLSAKISTDNIPLYEECYKNDDHKEIYDEDGNLKTELLNKILKYTNFRVRRCVKGVKSTYYIRQLRKVPNLRAANRKMTDEEKLHRSKFNGVFENYITENALDPNNPKYQRLLNNEQYQMAFAANIFNDNVTQITFSDGIDVEGLTDNLGRPLSEFFYTVIKNNAGHEFWYDEKEPLYSNKSIKDEYGKLGSTKFKEKYGVDYNGYNMEFSHCFGKITSGFEMYFKKDDTEENTAPQDYLKKLSSANHISNIINVGNLNPNAPIEKDEISNNLDNDITYRDTYFYGDLVEFNVMDFKENVLSNVMHRFNTAQRELLNNPKYSQYQYHEITQDDYDKLPFEVTEFSAVNGIEDKDKKTTDYETIGRPEGYIYQANYPIQIREYTRIRQDSHYSLRVRNAKPVQKDGILIQVTTMLNHNLKENDIIFICDDETDTRYVTQCVSVIDKTKFLMSPNYSEIILNATDFEDVESISNFSNTMYNIVGNNKTKYSTRFSWLELCDILNGKYGDDLNYPKFILRRKNSNIPDYAVYFGGNRYIWRDIVNVGDSRTQELPDYIFANGYFYITNRINFFLKRQDPFGNNGLYFDGTDKYPFFPNDPAGIMQDENNFITKDTNAIC